MQVWGRAQPPSLRQRPGCEGSSHGEMETPQPGAWGRAAADFVPSPARQQPGLGVGIHQTSLHREEMAQLEQLELFHLRIFPYVE